MPMVRRYFLPLFLAIIAIDQVTKWWAESALADGRTIPIVGDLLSFVLVYNPGAAFSFGTDHTYFFTVFSALVLAAIAWLVTKTTSRPWALALGTIGGGAAGNLIDRLAREPNVGEGHVVDFINYNGYFVGNVADIALVVGVLIVIVLEFRSIPLRTGGGPGTLGGAAAERGSASSAASASSAESPDEPESPAGDGGGSSGADRGAPGCAGEQGDKGAAESPEDRADGREATEPERGRESGPVTT